MGKITGKNAYLYICKNGGTLKSVPDTWAVSDFTLSLSKDTVEQELLGKTGNYFMAGALSIDGSLTNCRFAASGNYDLIESIVESNMIMISGGVNSSDGTALGFFFHSAQVTGYDVSFGDAGTITEASIDFTILNTKDIYYSAPYIRD